MKPVRSLLIVLFLLFSCQLTAPAYSLDSTSDEPGLTNAEKLDLFTTMRKCTVKVFAPLNDELLQTGSGVAIQRFGDDVLVVTNSHVISNEAHTGISPNITVKAWKGGDQRLLARVLCEKRDSTMMDFALIVVHDPDKTVALAHPAPTVPLPEKGMPVFACGNPHDEEFLCTTGKVLHTHLDPDSTDNYTIEHDALIEHGSSGGGLFDSRGDLIGINTWGGPDGRVGIAFLMSQVISWWAVRQVDVGASADWTEVPITVEDGSEIRVLALGHWVVDADGHTCPSVGCIPIDGVKPLDDRYGVGALLLRCGKVITNVAGALNRSDGITTASRPEEYVRKLADASGRIAFRSNLLDNAGASGHLTVFVLVLRPVIVVK